MIVKEIINAPFLREISQGQRKEELKMNKQRVVIGLLAFLVVFTVPLCALAAPDVNQKSPLSVQLDGLNLAGGYVVYVFKDDVWQEAGKLSFDKYFRQKEMDLNKYVPGDEKVKVRLVQKGGGAAHIDAVLLGQRSPGEVKGTDDVLALEKVSRKDFDVVDAFQKSIDLVFPSKRTDTVLSLTARVEGPRISETPFQFPLSNLYKEMTGNSEFYPYTLMPEGGDLEKKVRLDMSENPFFKEYSITGSGHPSGFTYGWVRNDDKNLYVTIDFTPDDTMDGDKDYSKVYVKTEEGIKEFKVSAPETTWGKPDFTYTDKVAYQHKVYDFSIPLKELGLGKEDVGKEILLAFAAYGTATPAEWTIEKSAIPTNLDLFTGDTGLAQYTIIVQNVSPGDPTIINVDDTNGGSWQFSGNATVIYARDFTCNGDQGLQTNLATIRETGDSDGAEVTVNCYQLAVSKDVNTSFTRDWTWTVDKSADQTDLTLSTGQQFLVNYRVVLDSTFIDRDWTANGTITIVNQNPSNEAELTSVADIISPDILASVSCPSFVVPSEGALSCTYTASLPDAASRTNTAVATLQNFEYDAHGDATTPAGMTDFSGSADVIFSDPSVEIDTCIDASDTNVGFLGTVCYASVPTTFTYSRFVGPYDVCGTYTVDNTASFVANDTGTTGSDGGTVTVNVPCTGGCTLTPGYWKTHSEFGPAPYDDSWAQLPSGASTPFFLSGQSYYEVLWTPPRGGNAYYILARQYIAAQLNFLNGADPSAAQTAYDEATALFNTYTPAEVAVLKGKNGKELRAQFISLAEGLDGYNDGYMGPGHCSEETLPLACTSEIGPGPSAVYWASLANYLAGILSVDYALHNLTADCTLNSVSVSSTTNTNGVVDTNTPVPVGTIPPGSSGSFTIQYQVPSGGNTFQSCLTISDDTGSEVMCVDITVPPPPA